MSDSWYVSEIKLAAQLDMSPITLRQWRAAGKGPPFVRLGRTVRYRIAEVQDWLQACHVGKAD